MAVVGCWQASLGIRSTIWQVCNCMGVCAHWVNVLTCVCVYLWVQCIGCLLVCLLYVPTLRSLDVCHSMSLGCYPTPFPLLVSEEHRICPLNFWVWPLWHISLPPLSWNTTASGLQIHQWRTARHTELQSLKLCVWDMSPLWLALEKAEIFCGALCIHMRACAIFVLSV